MTRAKAKQVEGAKLINQAGETVLLFKCTVPLNEEEHEILANKVRMEQEHSGIKIILVPYSVDPTVTEQAIEPAEAVATQDSKGHGPNSDPDLAGEGNA